METAISRDHGPRRKPWSTTSVPKTERLRIARTHALKEAIERYNHELLDDEERMVLLGRIRRLKKSLAS